MNRHLALYRLLRGVVAVLFLSAAHVQAAVDTQNYTLQAGTYQTFTATVGVTNTVSGKISGPGGVVLLGGGVIKFTNDANDYTGGTIVSNAYFLVTADHAAGQGPVTLSWDGYGLHLDCNTFANDVVLRASYGGASSPYASLRFLRSGVRLTGSLAQTHDYMLMLAPEPLPYHDAEASYGVTAIIESAITYPENHKGIVRSAAHGHLILRGPVKNVWRFYPQTDFMCHGITEFAAQGNVIDFIEMRYGRIHFSVPDALPGTEIWFNTGLSGDYTYRAQVQLDGHDQTIGALTWKMGQNYTPRHTYSLLVASTNAPATLTVTGIQTPSDAQHGFKLRQGLFGHLSFVLDADTTRYPDFYQEFADRVSPTDGAILVSNGLMRVTEGTTFKNVPTVAVAPNGRLEIDVTSAAAFAGVKSLTVDGSLTISETSPFPFTGTPDLVLGANAKLKLPKDVIFVVASLTLRAADGTLHPHGGGFVEHASLLSGRLFVQTDSLLSADWTGNGGEDTSVTTAANWSTAPEVPSFAGTVNAAFATGGSAAHFTTPADFASLQLSAADGFRFTGAGPLTIMHDFTVAGDGVAYTFEMPVHIQNHPDNAFNLTAGTTLAFAGGLTHPGCATRDLKMGLGTLLLGPNTYLPQSLTLTNGTLVLHGTNTFLSSFDIFAEDTMRTPRLVLSNAVLNADMKLFGRVREDKIVNITGGTSEITGYLDLMNPAGFCGDGGSTLVLSGGGDFRDKIFYATRNSSVPGIFTVIVRDKPIARFNKSLSFHADGNTVIRLECPSNGYQANPSELNILDINSGRFVFACNDAVTNTCVWFWSSGAGTLDLTTTRQRLAKFKYDGQNDDINRLIGQQRNAYVTGEYGSELAIDYGITVHNYTGGVGLAKSGSADTEVCFSNNVSRSCGDIRVGSGTLSFRASQWPLGTNIIVEAAGRLLLTQSATFGSFARLSVEAGGRIALAEGVLQKVRTFTKNGRACSPGTYGGPGSGADYMPDDGSFEGRGILKVTGNGLAISLR